ncbi:hypothetical protein [[Clostridium] hylemonae]|uniref:hypothetical protein n=1 Tax=[Clostridium] hylemonae TaxID=89153 RepID=UPI001105D60C|nr:hypothetical protein [[Clostridium] hylemonae]
MKNIINNIDEIMTEVSLDNISNKNIKVFSEELIENRKTCEKIKSTEANALFCCFLDIGEEVLGAYELAYKKCEQDLIAGKENYIAGFEQIEKKIIQNNELQIEIKSQKKKLRKINDRDKKIHALKQIEFNEKIIKFNSSSIKLIEDSNQAEIKAKFDMFKDIAESVNELFGNKEYIDNGKVINNIKNIFLSIASLFPYIGFPIAFKDIFKSTAEILKLRNAKKQMNISFDSIDSEIKKLENKVINTQLALLLLKFQLGDIDYLADFYSSEKE